MFTRAYGSDHLEVGIARTNLGALYHQAGRLEDAEREYRAGLAIREGTVGGGHPELAATLANLATVLASRGSFKQARETYLRALRLLDGKVTTEHPIRRDCEELLAELDRRAAAA